MEPMPALDRTEEGMGLAGDVTNSPNLTGGGGDLSASIHRDKAFLIELNSTALEPMRCGAHTNSRDDHICVDISIGCVNHVLSPGMADTCDHGAHSQVKAVKPWLYVSCCLPKVLAKGVAGGLDEGHVVVGLKFVG